MLALQGVYKISYSSAQVVIVFRFKQTQDQKESQICKTEWRDENRVSSGNLLTMKYHRK